MRNLKLLLAAVAIGSLMVLPRPGVASPLAAGLIEAGSAASGITAGLDQKVHYKKYYKNHRRYYNRRSYNRRYYNRRYRQRYYDDYDYYPSYGYYPYRPYYYPYGPFYGGSPFISFGFGFGGY